MKKLTMSVMLLAVVLLAGCVKVSAAAPKMFKVDTAISTVSGLHVFVNQTTGLRSFISNSYYQSAPYRYNLYPELASIEITVSGEISRGDFAEDYFSLYIKAPKDTDNVYLHNDKKTTDSNPEFTDGYYMLAVQWLDDDGAYGIYDDFYCFYVSFKNGNDILSRYFVYITYDLTFVD